MKQPTLFELPKATHPASTWDRYNTWFREAAQAERKANAQRDDQRTPTPKARKR